MKSLTDDDIKKILLLAGYYKSSYDNLSPEAALDLTDWAWSSGFSWPYTYFKFLTAFLSDRDFLTISHTIRCAHRRWLTTRTADYAITKPGWFKKLAQTTMRQLFGININDDIILKNFKYDKSSKQAFIAPF